MDTDRMAALLTALQEARYAGVRSVSYDGKTITYGSDVELAAAITGIGYDNPALRCGVDRRGRLKYLVAIPRFTSFLRRYWCRPCRHGPGGEPVRFGDVGKSKGVLYPNSDEYQNEPSLASGSLCLSRRRLGQRAE